MNTNRNQATGEDSPDFAFIRGPSDFESALICVDQRQICFLRIR